jgi:hypothetical protein
MSTKNGSSSPKDKNNPEWGYFVMQEQLEMMNSMFGEVMNEMTRLRAKVASLQNGLVYRGFKGRMPTR